MAKTQLEPRMSAVLKDVLTASFISENKREDLRKEASATMEVFSRKRAFKYLTLFFGIGEIIVIVLAIVFGIMGQYAMFSVVGLYELGFIVFLVLFLVFRGRYNARLLNLEDAIANEKRRNKDKTFPIGNMLCIMGPYRGSYRSMAMAVEELDTGDTFHYPNNGILFLDASQKHHYSIGFGSKKGEIQTEAGRRIILIDCAKGIFTAHDEVVFKAVTAPKTAPAKPVTTSAPAAKPVVKKAEPAPIVEEAVEAELRKAHSLLEKGLIEQEDYDKKKQAILDKYY